MNIENNDDQSQLHVLRSSWCTDLSYCYCLLFYNHLLTLLHGAKPFCQNIVFLRSVMRVGLGLFEYVT